MGPTRAPLGTRSTPSAGPMETGAQARCLNVAIRQLHLVQALRQRNLGRNQERSHPRESQERNQRRSLGRSLERSRERSQERSQERSPERSQEKERNRTKVEQEQILLLNVDANNSV